MCVCVCGKSFNDKGSLQQHMRFHASQKPYKCSTCEQTFRWKNQLENHMPLHTSEKYYCVMCHKSFKFRNSFMQHARYDLEGHRCCPCGHIYASQLDILSHTNKIILINQNNFSVFKNIEMLHYIILSHCIPVRVSLFISVSV